METITANFEEGQVCELRLEDLTMDPMQPRKYFDPEKFEELKSSVSARGVINPIIFTTTEGRLMIVAGHRRYLAAREAGCETIQGKFIKKDILEVAIIDNTIRDDLTPIEVAEAYQRLKTEKGMINKAIAAEFGKAESSISEILSLNKLPEDIKDECRKNKLFPLRDLIRVATAKSEGKMRIRFEALKKKVIGKVGKKTQIDPLQTFNRFLANMDGIGRQIETFDYSKLVDGQNDPVWSALMRLKLKINEVLDNFPNEFDTSKY